MLFKNKYKTAIILFFVLILFTIGFFVFQQFSSAADNCDELDGKEMCITSVSPNSGSTTGGETLTITGKNFPYVPTSSYIQDGLVLFFDGINNTGQGDKYHSDSTRTWRSVDSNKNYSTLLQNTLSFQSPGNTNCPQATWKTNGFLFDNNCYFGIMPGNDGQTGTWLEAGSLSQAIKDFPVGNNNYTIEAVYDPTYMTQTSTNGALLGMGNQTVNGVTKTGTVNNLRFAGSFAGCDATPFNQPICFSNYWYYDDINIMIDRTKSLTIVRNLAITFDNSLASKARRFYYNGIQDDDGGVYSYLSATCPTAGQGNNCRNSKSLSLNSAGSFVMGATSRVNGDGGEMRPGIKILAVRLYNRPLTKQEVSKNYSNDSLRFLSPPSINIGTNECTELIVVSTTQINCKVGLSTETGPRDLTLSYKSNSGTNINLKIPQAYNYLANPSTNPQITSISPNVLPKFVDSTISIQGLGFGTDAATSSVKIGDTYCDIQEYNDTDIKCQLHSLQNSFSSGFKDVTVHNGEDNANIVGYSSFYYLNTTQNPLKYTISPTPFGYQFLNVQSEKDYIGDIDVLITVPSGITIDNSVITNLWGMTVDGQTYKFKSKKDPDQDVVNNENIEYLLENIKLIGQARGDVSISLVNRSW